MHQIQFFEEEKNCLLEKAMQLILAILQSFSYRCNLHDGMLFFSLITISVKAGKSDALQKTTVL
mgnify:FL=1